MIINLTKGELTMEELFAKVKAFFADFDFMKAILALLFIELLF